MAERFQSLGEGKIEGRKLDPRTIIIRKDFNYRDLSSEAAQKHIAWLKESIRTEGVEQAIKVQYAEGKVYLVDGQCRVEACKQLFKEGVKVPSKSGKSILVASSGGNKPTAAVIDGKNVVIGLNAYIAAD